MNIKGKLRQFLGSSIMSFPKFLLASGLVWPSYALIILKNEDTPLGRPITLMEEALIGSLPLISSIITSPFGGAIVDKIGRKNTGVITVISIAISWALIAVIHKISVLLIGRVIFGISGGLLMQVAWSFTAEISEDSVRGFMSSMPSVMYAFGALISIVLGWVSTYQNIIYINIALSIGNGLVMFLLPESPVYLNLIGKEEDAIKSLAFYRAASVTDKAVRDEMSIFKNQEEKKDKASTLLPTEEPLCLDAEKQNLQDCAFVPPLKVTGWRYFRTSRASRWSLFLAALLMTLSILTGVIAVQVYGGSLFLKATPSLSPDFCAVLLASILLIGSICGASFTDLFGRRVLLISASAVNGLCMLGLGTLVKWSWGPEWFIPALILIFCFVFNLGGGTIPYLLLAEIFVPEVKGFAQSIMMLWLYVVNFILLLAFVPAVELIGLDVVFFVFAGFAFLTTLCTHFMLPETKGMNPYAIEEMFTRRTQKVNS